MNASAAVVLDLFLGSGRIGAVVLSKKEALVLHRVFQLFFCRSCVVGQCVRPGVGVPRSVLGQRGGIVISSDIWPWPFGGL